MGPEEARAHWLSEAAGHRSAGRPVQSQLAEYFAAAAAGQPEASRLAPEPYRRGLRELDIPARRAC